MELPLGGGRGWSQVPHTSADCFNRETMGGSSSNKNKARHLNEPKQKAMSHAWVYREDSLLTLPLHLQRAEKPPLFVGGVGRGFVLFVSF